VGLTAFPLGLKRARIAAYARVRLTGIDVARDRDLGVPWPACARSRRFRASSRVAIAASLAPVVLVVVACPRCGQATTFGRSASEAAR